MNIPLEKADPDHAEDFVVVVAAAMVVGDVDVDLLIQMTDVTSVVSQDIMPMTVLDPQVQEVEVTVDLPDIQGKKQYNKPFMSTVY